MSHLTATYEVRESKSTVYKLEKHQSEGGIFWIMFAEKDGEIVRETVTSKRRLSQETKDWFGVEK